MTKCGLIVKILDDLARKENFKDYESYINNAKQFAFSWSTRYTNEKMFSREDRMSRYAELTTSHIGRIVRCIVESVIHATYEVTEREGSTLALWIEKFCQRVSKEIVVPPSTLKQASARRVVDFSNLRKIILDQLDIVKASLLNAFEKETKYSVDWHGTPPPQQILDQIWGCPEQCPACNEPCSIRTPDHYSSGVSLMCVVHRPQGIGGVRWAGDGVFDGVRVRKDQLTHWTCNYDLYRKKVAFKYAAWNIALDPNNSVSKYWMWFMATYQSQLADMYEAKLPDIPVSFALCYRFFKCI